MNGKISKKTALTTANNFINTIESATYTTYTITVVTEVMEGAVMPKSNKKLKFIKKLSPRRKDIDCQNNDPINEFEATMQIKRAQVEWRAAH